MNIFRSVLLGLLAGIFFSANTQAGLVAHYPLDGDGTDISGNGHNGTVNGAAATTDRDGNPNAAMLFNGTSDYIEIPDAPAFSSHELGEITVMGWVNVAAFATDGHGQARQPIMSKGNVGFWEWALYVYDDGSVGFSTWTQGGSSHNEISGGQISTGTWHHVAGTFVDGVINQVYLDGLPVTASTNFSGSAYDGSVNPRIGSRADGQFLNAVIDDVRVYDNHMDGNQIREAAGIPVQPVPTLSQWALILMAMLIAMVGVARTYRA